MRPAIKRLALLIVPVIGASAQQAPFNKQRLAVKNGDLALAVYVYKPEGAGPFPTLFWNHGSEKNPGGGPQFDSVAKIFVPAGYVVVATVRRGHGGSQGTYIVDTLNVHRERGDGSDRALMVKLLETEQLDDQLAGMALAKTLPYVDRNKMVVAGCSFGGIQTLLAAERSRELKAAFAISPAAQTWALNPILQERLKTAVRKIAVPLFVIAPPQDNNLDPPRVLAEEAKRAGKTRFAMKIYPPTMPDSEQVHCFGGAKGFHNWASDAIDFFRGALK
jgi:carboxymethylenebutenolidase